MTSKSFEELRICQLSEELADGVWKMVRHWDILARDTVGKQLIRAADSIGANIAEGYGRGSFQDNAGSCESLAARSTKLGTGCDEPIGGSFSPTWKSLC